MKFLRQIKFEIRNILRSKFLLITGIIIVAFSVLIPVIITFTQAAMTNANGGRPMPMGGVYYEKMAYEGYRGDGNQESITVNGVTITNNNPLFWQIKSNMDEKAMLANGSSNFSTPEAIDLEIEMLDMQIDYYLHFVKLITNPQDYRMELAWMGNGGLNDKFIYEHKDVDAEVLIEVIYKGKVPDNQMLESFKKKYYDITPEQRQAAYIKVDESLDTIYSVLENADFPKYIELRIQQENDQIVSLNESIAIQQDIITKNPSQEENGNQMIEDMKKQIKLIQDNNIAIWKLRLEKNIIPGERTWQNAALSDMENSNRILAFDLAMVSEEQFRKTQYLVEQYKTYQKYKDATQARINVQNNKLIIANKSLRAEKPDMQYVREGSRNNTVEFLYFSIIIALFAALVGGWIMASEFQQGTIRLLMIRPRKRTKILMSKFIAALLVSLAMYLCSGLLNIITNGICFGFTDFGFPNYTVGGEINFFAYFVPIFLLCSVTIILAFCVAFMLSVVVKNIAVAIAIPIVCFIGCFILTSGIAYRSIVDWIGYTPIPYVQLSSFFLQYSTVKNMMENGVMMNLPLGIGYLLVLSAACIFTSILVFRKRDITN